MRRLTASNIAVSASPLGSVKDVFSPAPPLRSHEREFQPEPPTITWRMGLWGGAAAAILI